MLLYVGMLVFNDTHAHPRTMSLRAAIGLQIMELIADKKGIDQDLFKTIGADLNRMKKEVEGAGGNGNGSGGKHRLPPPVGERDPKRPRM